MDDPFLNRMNSWQGIVKKEQEAIFEKSIDLKHHLKISFENTIFGMRLFFLTIPKPLRQHPILKKDHPFRYIHGFKRKTLRGYK
jgi:hypothetical protein